MTLCEGWAGNQDAKQQRNEGNIPFGKTDEICKVRYSRVKLCRAEKINFSGDFIQNLLNNSREFFRNLI